MNDAQKKLFISWLNDAHAMEEGLERVLEKQINETEDRPVMQAKLQEHLEETKHHGVLVREALARYGTEPSTTKDVMSKMSAVWSGMTTSMAGDALVKNVHSSYAAEHFEIASYTVIRAAASEYGDTETVAMCDEILEDERDMAAALFNALPEVVSDQMKDAIDE